MKKLSQHLFVELHYLFGALPHLFDFYFVVFCLSFTFERLRREARVAYKTMGICAHKFGVFTHGQLYHLFRGLRHIFGGLRHLFLSSFVSITVHLSTIIFHLVIITFHLRYKINDGGHEINDEGREINDGGHKINDGGREINIFSSKYIFSSK